MKDSKKGILFVAVIWTIFLVFMNFVPERFPTWWLEYRPYYKIQANLMVVAVIISMTMIAFLPESKSQKLRRDQD